MLWVCLGSGPSLTPEDVAACRPFPTIAINNTVELAPWATICFAADYSWWDERRGLPWFTGRKASMAVFNSARYPDVEVYQQGGDGGIDERPDYLRTGRNSGFSAIGLAVKEGATDIVLLGYDMQPSASGEHHWHQPHLGNRHPSYARSISFFETLKEPLTRLGVRVFNASTSTAIPPSIFPHVPLHEVICQSLQSR